MSSEELCEPMAMDESGHSELCVGADELSRKMLQELGIRKGEITNASWIRAMILLALSANEKLELADLFSESRGADHLEGLSNASIICVLDGLIDSGQVTVEEESGTYYFKAPPLSNDERRSLKHLLEKNISIFGAPEEEE